MKKSVCYMRAYTILEIVHRSNNFVADTEGIFILFSSIILKSVFTKFNGLKNFEY